MIVAAILFAWLQYAGDGLPHARAIVTGACPVATFDGRPAKMTERAQATAAFADTVCDVAVPERAKSVKLGVRSVPAPAHAVHTIVVFGDTGCRILAPAAFQACDDPQKWPFPVVARSVARVHPDLIVDVGDYFYRESPCPATFNGCAGSPSGDQAPAWYADWFTPGAAFFSSAPLVLARGNHEDCRRGPLGWTRYLDAFPGGVCPAMDAPYAATFDGLRIVVFDSAIANDEKVVPANAAPLKANFDTARNLVAGPTWFLTHRPPYLNADQAATMGSDLDPFAAVLAGHIHLFAVVNQPPHAPMVINGIGGDTLDNAQGAQLRATLGPDARSVSVNFGFAVYTRTATGWAISLRDPDGVERGRCSLTLGRPGTVRC
jgi:hypothetical protein